ncbi:hypothetical protein C8Q73DRAFT_630390, partial [Cubamyces lactineus]
PEWVKEASLFFATLSADRRWISVVEGWLQLEKNLGYPESQDARLPTKGRPIEVRQWIQKHRKFASKPSIRKVAEFGASCELWWTGMQPAERIRDGQKYHRPSEVLPSCVWDSLRRGGPNGLFLVLLALGWW